MVTRATQGFPRLKIESLRLPQYCLGLSTKNLEGHTGLLKIVKNLHLVDLSKDFFKQ